MIILKCNKCAMHFRRDKIKAGQQPEKHTCSEQGCKIHFSSGKSADIPSVIHLYMNSKEPYPPHIISSK